MTTKVLNQLALETDQERIRVFFVEALEETLALGPKRCIVVCGDQPESERRKLSGSWAILAVIMRGEEQLELPRDAAVDRLMRGETLLWGLGGQGRLRPVPQEYVRVAAKIWPGQVRFECNHVKVDRNGPRDTLVNVFMIQEPVLGACRELIDVAMRLKRDGIATGAEPALMQAILRLLLYQLKNARGAPANPRSKAWQEILRHIDANLGKPMSRKELAQSVGMHPQNVSRLFRLYAGKSFKEYVTEQRMARAFSLLQEPSASVKDTCYACGYQDVPHFTRVFRRTYGTSPGRVSRTRN